MVNSIKLNTINIQSMANKWFNTWYCKSNKNDYMISAQQVLNVKSMSFITYMNNVDVYVNLTVLEMIYWAIQVRQVEG